MPTNPETNASLITPWLLRWNVASSTVASRLSQLNGTLLGRRRDGSWRITLPGHEWRGTEIGPDAQLEPEPVVDRVRRPFRQAAISRALVSGGRKHAVRVLDQASGQPLERVTVILESRSGLSYRAKTNEEGYAEVELLDDDIEKLEVLPPDAYWPKVVREGISSSPGVELEIGLVPLSPLDRAYGWGLKRAMKIDRVHQSGIRGKGVRVAVLDTGVSPHPDLRIVRGFNTIDEEPETRWQDTQWHGTHVAGIMAAIGLPSSLTGVAPDAELHAVRVGKVVGLEKFRFSNEMFETDLIEGIQWCVDNEIEVINLSLFSRQTRALEDIIEEAYQRGIVLVAPTGNRQRPGDQSGVDYPASSPRVIAVGAVGRLGTYPQDSYFQTAERGACFSPRFPDYYIPGFSKTGTGVDFVAPGVAILSTVPATLKGWDVDNSRLSGYTSWMGTSQAAPFISGLVALILGSHPEIREMRDGQKTESVRSVLANASISLKVDQLYQGNGLPFAPACVQPAAELE